MRYFYKAFVKRVVDGDTVDLVFDLGFEISACFRCRLYGINAPEMHRVKKSSEQHQKGEAAAKYLRDRIEGKVVYVRSNEYEREKFGRILVTIWTEERDHPAFASSVNQELIDRGHAVPARY